ncbi:type III PLP-dependent enzyme [Pseudohalioglobus sediminis]|uniref:ornithine decarboxylase n=1 Tax=Pseudohalioglobus sediminis TaxID=2606449 RepID=A0A5B0X294_9GAMM|nr:type III PLP-dependent enzyme [Pseudohalioglobus sediminis]KAA1193322.1 type III PLP-dependent enzyme [Pseudohalioglobus sediminis]
MTGSNARVFQRPETAGSYRDCAQITGELKPTDPLYLYCPATLQGRAAAFLDGFPGQVSYAVKANPEQRVLATLAASGLRHFDVASLEEVRCVTATAPHATVHFNNPIKAEEAVAEAYLRHGVRSFAVDELQEVDKIRRCTGADPTVTYAVRFKLPHTAAAYDFGSKFGADEEAAVALLRAIKQLGARAALTFHPGSQCTEPAMYARYIRAAARIVTRAGVQVDFINVGGGFPEYYPGQTLPDLATYFSHIGDAASKYLHSNTPLICEPGRAMVGSSVSLLTRVIHVRDCGVNLFINDGVYGGMQEQSLVDLQLPVRAWRDGKLLAGPSRQYRIFGPTCDPVDRLSRETGLPEGLRAGDYLEFGLLGAYGSATSTRFNGFHSNTYVNVAAGTDFTGQRADQPSGALASA